ncbi:glutamate--cysteine ligase EgtA [Actinorhabdospora filicis]|uniref:Glutamate--cysteine ligase EgtA n=1 Tax=Actinorhabdospora filicis TaxID=1785913 RepID=A0A9W6SGT2_9ACTN|nr:ergothioneine biosynthesis glutamate--cysteine ligase EgtA [Actinorhabdospora filicis]GLZ76023.1 glutamate--cysteine ligase EgtA [Actinorhabdospora filicis]
MTALSARTALTVGEAAEHIAAGAFRTGTPGRVGVELEWLVRPGRDRLDRADPARLAAQVTATGAPRHGSLTFEPGGALELSSLPASGLAECVRRTSADLARVRAALDPLGLSLVGLGLDPDRRPRRVRRSPRYSAMEAYFDRDGRAGRWMMANTASVQICLDAGHEEPGPLGHAERWELARLAGPVLTAAFANSPLRLGAPSGWKSTRMRVWSRVDPRRTAPIGTGEPRAAWARYALDAHVMMIRRDDGPWDVPRGLRLRDWLASGGASLDDLEYHLSTLFPPVRPRGYLELRMVDAQSGDDWIVPLALATALFDDPEAGAKARAALRSLPVVDVWERAARHGLDDPSLARAARACFDAAIPALARLGAGALADPVGEFAERYARRGRCPADDVLSLA